MDQDTTHWLSDTHWDVRGMSLTICCGSDQKAAFNNQIALKTQNVVRLQLAGVGEYVEGRKVWGSGGKNKQQ